MTPSHAERRESRRMLWFVVLAVLSAYLAPYLLLGRDAPLLIHDNLDSVYVTYSVLVDSGQLFAQGTEVVDQPLGGLPRAALPSEFDAFTWLYLVFGPFGAYLANRFIMTAAAFVGTYLLLTRHVGLDDKFPIPAIGAATCFALLPFWPFGGLSVAGLPMLAYALLNIRSGDRRWFNWCIVSVFPFYALLLFSGFFILPFFGLIALYDLANGRRDLGLLAALGLLSALYLFSHYRLFLEFFTSSGFTSHRVDFATVSVDLPSAMLESARMFVFGQYHAPSLHHWVVLPTVVWGLVLAFARARKRWWLICGVLLALLAGTSLFLGLYRWDAVFRFRQAVWEMLPMQFDRLAWSHPALWTVLFAIALQNILQQLGKTRRGYSVIVAIVAAQLVLLFHHHEFRQNWKNPSVRQFFAQEQFQQVRAVLDEAQGGGRVASLGMHPSIALHNGFRTVDGYFPSYPLSYKREFRAVIAGELEKNDLLRNYYDHWGSRVYLFSHELRSNADYVMNRASNSFEIAHLDLDYDRFRALGGRYVLSAVRVDMDLNPRLRFLRLIEDPKSAWDIYVYEVRDDARAAGERK